MRWGFASGPAGDSLPATITPSHTAMRCSRLQTSSEGHHARPPSYRHGHALPPGICGGFAGGRARCSEPLISTPRPPSHTAMRCSRLPAVGRCGGVADDGHTITRTATITHGHALLPTACILGGASRTATITHGHALLPTADILGGASHTATITTPHTDGGALRRGT